MRSIKLAFFAIAIAVSFLGACNKVPEDPLRLASSPWPGYEPFYLGRDLGYFDESLVKIFELPSADITMESFRNRSTDLATLTLDEVIELLDDGMKLRVALILDVSHGGDAVLARPDIKELSDIKGKRISIINIPLGLYMLNRLLNKAGVSREDVEVFPMAESKQLKFYNDGKADVVITFEPVKTKLKEAGAHVIFDSSMIPNEIFDLLVVHEDVYLKRKGDVCKITKGWFRTLSYMTDNYDDSAKRITRRLGLSVRDYDALLDGIILPDNSENMKLLSGDTPGLIIPGEKLSEIMLYEKQISKKIDLSSAIDASFADCYK